MDAVGNSAHLFRSHPVASQHSACTASTPVAAAARLQGQRIWQDGAALPGIVGALTVAVACGCGGYARRWHARRPCRVRADMASTLNAAWRRRELPLLGISGLIPLAPGFAAAKEATTDDEVIAVVDGDTVKLAKFGRCRLIGVNTPETVSPKQQAGAPPDCYGPEASALTKQLLPKGTQVRVEVDAEPADRYGRSLAYLYRSQDGLFINAELVKQGAARHLKVAPNVRYDSLFVKLESEASAAQRGLWKACPAGKVPAAGAAPKPAAGAAAGSAASGNPGDVKNCKDFKTYAEAKAWFDSYFPLYGDIAKLDGDGDGKPCESLLKKEKAVAK